MKNEWKFVDDYPVVDYRCGLKAGDKLRLKKDLVLTEEGKPTGKVLAAGGIWTVLKGAADRNPVLWLRQPDGKTHTWSDDESVFLDFEKIEDGV